MYNSGGSEDFYDYIRLKNILYLSIIVNKEECGGFIMDNGNGALSRIVDGNLFAVINNEISDESNS